MKRAGTIRRILATLLAAVMLVSMFPAVAAGTEVYLEAESADPRAEGGWTEAVVKDMTDPECGGGQLYLVQNKGSVLEGGTLQFTLTVPEPGNYEVYVTTKDNNGRGIFQFSADGVALGEPIDFFQAEAEYEGDWGTYREHKLGTVSFESETALLTATCTGTNAGRQGDYCGIAVDRFRLVPTEEGGSTEEEILYQNTFDVLPEELSGRDWTLMKMSEGYALQGTDSSTAGLLAALSSAGEMPSSYTVVIDMMMTEELGGSGYGAGVVFGYQDNTHFLHHRLNVGIGKYAELYQWAGSAKKLSSSAFDAGLYQPYRLRVVVDGQNVTCYIDGNKTNEAQVSSGAGQVGPASIQCSDTL